MPLNSILSTAYAYYIYVYCIYNRYYYKWWVPYYHGRRMHSKIQLGSANIFEIAQQ